jgi:xylulokinase
MEFLLGLDVGSSRTKAVLLDHAGRVVATAAVATPFAARSAGVEMEVDALLDCLRSVVAALGGRRAGVVATGIAGIAESGAPLDASRRALAPVIAWHDGRGREAVEVLERRFGPDLPLRIGQRIRTVATVAKLGWLVSHGVAGMQRWLGVPELGLHALTGAEATEFSLTARTGCYDVTTKRWMPEVAEALGFSVDVFPRVLPAGVAMGRVSEEASRSFGLPAGTPVTIAGHDHLAGMAGAGVGPRDAANSVGTAETIVARLTTLPDMAAALANDVRLTVHPGGREWAALVGAARAGLMIEAGAGSLRRSVGDLDRLAAGAAPVDVAGAVDALASGRPFAWPEAPIGGLWAGLLAALSARTAEAYTRLAAVVGPRDRLVVFGGGRASEPWLGAKAAALAIPVVRSGVESAVARGAALYAGVAAGWWPSVAEAGSPSSQNGYPAGF